jgi:YbgC/YbaW family acyl-CoA thioester hydrolase
MTAFRHRHRVRYVECDMQNVVHNSNYLVFVDDAVDVWLRTALAGTAELGGLFDIMVKKAEVVWLAPCRNGEHIDMDVSVSRWGNTSFDVEVIGSVDGDTRFTCTEVQVCVDPKSYRPMVIPDSVRQGLST